MKRNLIWLAAMAALLVSCGAPGGKERVTDVQAHRGGMGLYPEESLEAMLNSVDLGVNTLEMDLCITRDKKVILSHDKYFHHRYASYPDGTPVLEGDPKIKGKIKQLQRQMAQSRMMQQVPQADVIVRNPTHVAVALRYRVGEDQAPVVLAMGVDSLALRIVSVAEANDICTV